LALCSYRVVVIMTIYSTDTMVHPHGLVTDRFQRVLGTFEISSHSHNLSMLLPAQVDNTQNSLIEGSVSTAPAGKGQIRAAREECFNLISTPY
jgi:hypothetical protein